ncbi:MAG: oligosaccharide flippase family protein [Deltaproteobacteria bacterium]|nr:oligosaccharide flippase family protein [Deltaproteobacteria bacterium]
MSKIIKNTFLYSIGNIIPQAAGFFLLPIYTRYLTPADYGIVSSMQVLNTILAVFFTLAIERSVYRLYWDYKTEKGKKDYLGSVVVALCSIATIILLLLFLFKGFVGLIYKSIPFYPFYAYAIVTAYFSVLGLIPKIYLQLKQKAASFVILSIMQFAANTTFILWFIVGLKAGAEGMLKGQMLGYGVMLPVFLFIGFRIINYTVNLSILRESLKFSLPMIPALLSAWVLNLSDRIFIERYFSLADVGIYSLGYKIAGLVLILSSAFNMAYEPLFYNLANSDDQLMARKKLFFYNNTFVMVILVICFFVSLFSKEAIVILLDERYAEAYKIVPIIALAYFISQAGGLMNRLIYQEKKTFALMIIVIFGALLNIGLNFLFVPPLGAYGAAYATVLSFAGLFAVEYWYAKKCYFINYDWSKIIKGLLIAIPIASTAYFIEVNILLSLFIKLIVVSIASMFLYARFGVQLKSVFAGKNNENELTDSI